MEFDNFLCWFNGKDYVNVRWKKNPDEFHSTVTCNVTIYDKCPLCDRFVTVSKEPYWVKKNSMVWWTSSTLLNEILFDRNVDIAHY